MQPERWRQIEELYHAALEREPSERAAFVNDACAGNPELRKEIESLLVCDESAAHFIETPAFDATARAIAEDRVSHMAGQQIGYYRLLTSLGAGGMGEVYLAEDTRLNRKVAIKFLLVNSTTDEQARKRLLREAQATARLEHPNICAVYEAGEHAGASFIAMQYVEGETLASRMARTPLGLTEILDIAIQIADALSEAHAHSIIHRDMKPQNVIINTRGQVKVLDFGLAKMTQEQQVSDDDETRSMLTMPGLLIGTAPYMSPEQVRGEVLDARSDIFSFGIVLYEMLSGLQPFASPTVAETLSAILTKEPPPLPRFAIDGPRELGRVVKDCLNKDREKRPEDLRGVILDLKTARRDSEAITGTQPSPSTHRLSSPDTQPGPIRIRTLASRRVFIAAVLIALGVGGTLYALLRNPSLSSGTSATVSAPIHSLAVLPLKSLSAGVDDDYLGLGIADTIIAKVSQIGELSVRPTSAVRKYTNQESDSLVAARELQTDAVLDGTVQRSGDRLRVTLNLRAKDGASIWADIFNIRSTDIFEMQDEVSRQVTEKLRLKLTVGQQPGARPPRPVNPDAYDCYLRYKFYASRQNREDNQTAIELLERAGSLDPDFAQARAALAVAYSSKAFWFAPQEKELTEKAFVNVERALTLDPVLPEAHYARGLILWTHTNRFPHELAIQSFRRAIELNPNFYEAHHSLGVIYSHIGLLDKGMEEFQKALSINPNNNVVRFRIAANKSQRQNHQEALNDLNSIPSNSIPTYDYQKASSLFHLGGMKEAWAVVNEFLSANPRDEGGLLTSVKAILFAAAGRNSEAEAAIKRAIEIGHDYGHFHHSAYSIACAYALMNKPAQALKYLQFAAEDGLPDYPLFEKDEALRNVRNDPQFITFMAKLKEQWESFNAKF